MIKHITVENSIAASDLTWHHVTHFNRKRPNTALHEPTQQGLPKYNMVQHATMEHHSTNLLNMAHVTQHSTH